MPDFIPDLSVILTFALAGIVLAITPGPDMALVISRTLNHGPVHGVFATLGMAAGIMLHAGLAAIGLSLLIAASPTAFFILKVGGALYLLFLAVQSLRSRGGLVLRKKRGGEANIVSSFLLGFGSNITNPKVILFFVTFLPQFVSATDPGAAGKLVFFGFEFLLIGIPVNLLCVIAAGWLAKTLTESPIIQRVLNWSFAAVFATFAATILLMEGRK